MLDELRCNYCLGINGHHGLGDPHGPCPLAGLVEHGIPIPTNDEVLTDLVEFAAEFLQRRTGTR
jgi:hypothetical protein